MTLGEFQREHGARVRRAEAMRLLGIVDKQAFRKVVDANPTLRHRLNGEAQDRYLTAAIHALLYTAPARCATRGEARK